MHSILKILLVEDSEGDALLFSEYLNTVFPNLDITHCLLLSEATRFLNNNNCDLILLDLTLPDSVGNSSVKEITELFRTIPIIVLTGYEDKQYAIDTLQLGVQDYLIKDEVTPAVLQKSVQYSIERNKIQQIVISNEKRFRSVIENSSDGYALIDLNGKIHELSENGKFKLNLHPVDEDGFFNIERIHPNFRKAVLRSFIEVSKEPKAISTVEFKYKFKNDEYKWIESSIYNLLNEPSVNAIVLNYRDISLRKEEEEQRLLLIEELIQTNTDLKQFGFITSHNLRAPLTNLLAIVDLLDIGQIKDTTTIELLEAFKSATFQLNDTLNDLIKVLFIRENKFKAIECIDFESVINRNMHDLKSLIQNTNISIFTDFSEATCVNFDPNYLESILLNLLSNSIKYAANDRKLEIQIHTKVEGEFTLLEFSDNGIGMDMDKVGDRIFGLYQRFHDRPDSKGIDLYLMHSQVTALGGKISVVSKPNIGTTFCIRFKNLVENKN